MSWLWFAALEDASGPPPEPLLAARAEPLDGGPALTLACWAAAQAPPAGAVRIAARAVGPEGPAVRLSLTLAPDGVRLPFDDPAVVEARRAVLRGPAPPVLSTLVEGDSIFAGAVVGVLEEGRVSPPDDPFARIFPARRLRVPPGLLRPAPAPAGPSLERYGGGRPWPIPRFAYDDGADRSSSRFSRA